MRSATVPSAAIAGVLLLAGCTGAASGGADDAAAAVSPVTATPAAATVLIADTDPAASAASTSRALFTSSPVVVVASSEDPGGQLLGASAAVALGVPLLLSDGGSQDPVTAELDRLGATDVLAVGTDLPADQERTVVAVPAEVDAVQQATGLELGAGDPVADDEAVAAVAGLDPGDPVALLPAGARTDATGSEDVDQLPAVQPAEPLTDVVVLASGGPESLAGVATARAAGAVVQLTDGQTDPRASARVVDALAAARPAAVLALGADFAGVQGLDWKTATAATGTQLPGGGQLLFPEHFFVALYGYPDGGALGVLGEQPLEAVDHPGRADRGAVPRPGAGQDRRPDVRDHRHGRLGVGRVRTATTPPRPTSRRCGPTCEAAGRRRALRGAGPAAGPHRLPDPGQAVPVAAGAALRRTGAGPGVAAAARPGAPDARSARSASTRSTRWSAGWPT